MALQGYRMGNKLKSVIGNRTVFFEIKSLFTVGDGFRDIVPDFASKNFFGLKPSLNFQQLSAMPLKYYWALLILWIVIGISGTIFNKGLLVSQILYKKTNLSIEMKCIIPFIVTGIVGLTVPALLGGGHDLIMSLQNLNIHM